MQIWQRLFVCSTTHTHIRKIEDFVPYIAGVVFFNKNKTLFNMRWDVWQTINISRLFVKRYVYKSIKISPKFCSIVCFYCLLINDVINNWYWYYNERKREIGRDGRGGGREGEGMSGGRGRGVGEESCVQSQPKQVAGGWNVSFNNSNDRKWCQLIWL